MSEAKDLTLHNFSTGLLCGLVACGAPIGGWRFHDTYAHAAIEELYCDLDQRSTLNLRFAIFLDLYGKSADWDDQVDALMSEGWLTRSMPEGEFTIRVSGLVISNWIRGESPRVPGGEGLWLDCARHFQERYGQGLRALYI